MDFYFLFWIFSAFISTCYTYVWDVRMDWGLMDPSHGFLRAKLLFKHLVSRGADQMKWNFFPRPEAVPLAKTDWGRYWGLDPALVTSFRAVRRFIHFTLIESYLQQPPLYNGQVFSSRLCADRYALLLLKPPYNGHVSATTSYFCPKLAVVGRFNCTKKGLNCLLDIKTSSI